MGADLSLWQMLYASAGLWGVALLLPLYLLSLIRGDPAGYNLVHALAIGATLGTVLALSGVAAPLGISFYNEQFGIDALLLAMVAALALRSPRFYPLVIAALQLLIAIIGALAATDLIPKKGTHAVMICALGILQLGVLAYGLIAHRRQPASRTRGDFRDSHLVPRANRAR